MQCQTTANLINSDRRYDGPAILCPFGEFAGLTWDSQEDCIEGSEKLEALFECMATDTCTTFSTTETTTTTTTTSTSTTSTTTVEPVEHCAQFVTYPQQECQSKLVKEKAENGVECDCEGQTPCHSLFFSENKIAPSTPLKKTLFHYPPTLRLRIICCKTRFGSFDLSMGWRANLRRRWIVQRQRDGSP